MIAPPFPLVTSRQHGDAWISGTRFSGEINRRAFLIQHGAGRTDPLGTDTGATIALTTAATGGDMFRAMMAVADGTERAANRADLVLAGGTLYRMGITRSVTTMFVNIAMVTATALATKGATLTTGGTITSPTLGAGGCTNR